MINAYTLYPHVDPMWRMIIVRILIQINHTSACPYPFHLRILVCLLLKIAIQVGKRVRNENSRVIASNFQH